jgi:adenylyl-sulfate kinase
VWLTGLPSSGKSSIGALLEKRLLREGRSAYRLDGDNLRHGLNGDLSFSPEDRAENVRRTAYVAGLLADAGTVAIVSLVSPYRSDRNAARALHDEDDLNFIEIFVNTPADECARRDPKGLYEKARRGEITGFTGVDAPYEQPLSPDLELTPGDPEVHLERILRVLRAREVLPLV